MNGLTVDPGRDACWSGVADYFKWIKTALVGNIWMIIISNGRQRGDELRRDSGLAST